jgi:ubiquinone/menaquinone biosynthesis C-methylase UbiE
MGFDKSVLNYYNKGLEKDRLVQDDFIDIEKIRTLDILSRHLPDPPAIIFDIGGAAGVYAFILAEKGYQVHLIDPVKLHIDQATEDNKTKEKTLVSIEIGDARNIQKEDKSADCILLFGPLYHLTEQKDRLQALKEAYRLLKPRGLVFSAGISRFASLFNGFERDFIFDDSFVKIVEQDLLNGQHRNPSGKNEYFTTSYFHHPDELRNEHVQAGFHSVELFTVEGPLRMIGNIQQYLQQDRIDLFLKYARRIEQEPTLMGSTSHLLAIGKK